MSVKRSNNQLKFDTFREKYSVFTYQGLDIVKDADGVWFTYHFDIDGLHFFNPTVGFMQREFYHWEQLDDSALRVLAFNAGMVELVSYWKSLCPKRVVIKPFSLDDEQISFWKKLYFNGLGEFFYLNDISTDIDAFMTIESCGDAHTQPFSITLDDGVVVPVGGGKDSVVTLELLRKKMPIRPLIVNPRGATVACVEAAGFSLDDCIVIKRAIDPHLLELNADGCLNGHTPFSAMLAFLTIAAGVATGNRYIALSNESSANESTVKGTNINHQYSKSIEFEKDFRDYISACVNADIQYFSFLRPLSEMQIAMLFSRFKQYHSVFKSCNVGSKTDIWCCKCPKCLFTWIILSPFLNNDELKNIFGSDLSRDVTLRPVYEELSGMTEVKPFECVGTIDEVRAAVDTMTDKQNSIFNDSPNAKYSVNQIIKGFDEDNFLPTTFLNILKSAVYGK